MFLTRSLYLQDHCDLLELTFTINDLTFWLLVYTIDGKSLEKCILCLYTLHHFGTPVNFGFNPSDLC